MFERHLFVGHILYFRMSGKETAFDGTALLNNHAVGDKGTFEMALGIDLRAVAIHHETVVPLPIKTIPSLSTVSKTE